MKQITVDEIMQRRPCGWDKKNDGQNYTRERVEELFAGRETITMLDVLDMAGEGAIPAEDAVWVFTRLGMAAGEDHRLFAAICAAEALPVFEARFPDDKRPRRAIEAAVDYAHGLISAAKLDAASAAAWDAAWDAAEAAAEDATYNEAWERQLLYIHSILTGEWCRGGKQ